MNIVRCMYEGNPCFGSVEGRHIILLEGTPFGKVRKTSRSIPLEGTELLAPCEPTKAVCIGLNYRDHAEECHIPLPTSPVVFMKASGCVIGPGQPIVYPALSNRVDHEAELAIVIGKRTRHVSEQEAQSHILGYTCANDVTARDLQPEQGQWTIAKSFDTFLPLGPMITDEIDPSDCDVWTKVNGEIRQQSNTRHLIFKPSFLVSFISRIMTLYPGDVIITGTPAGIGPMQVGDTVEVGISGIGTLANPIVAESTVSAN